MAESKVQTLGKYIATEDCFFQGRYLKRGEIILLEIKPNHACIVPYTGYETEGKDTAYFDPIQDSIEKRRLKSAMASFM